MHRHWDRDGAEPETETAPMRTQGTYQSAAIHTDAALRLMRRGGLRARWRFKNTLRRRCVSKPTKLEVSSFTNINVNIYKHGHQKYQQRLVACAAIFNKPSQTVTSDIQQTVFQRFR